MTKQFRLFEFLINIHFLLTFYKQFNADIIKDQNWMQTLEEYHFLQSEMSLLLLTSIFLFDGVRGVYILMVLCSILLYLNGIFSAEYPSLTIVVGFFVSLESLVSYYSPTYNFPMLTG
jgi:hypothetical protein